MKGIILLKDHFEDVEALITIDMLRRAKIDLTVVSMNETLSVKSQSGITYTADVLITDINYKEYDYVILPGGKAVFEYHVNSNLTKTILRDFVTSNKLCACICAAPMVLGVQGLLDNLRYTCFPGCENSLFGGIYTSKDVEVSNNIITSKACGTTFDFSFEIIKYLTDEETSLKVKNSVYYK